ncbi:MAG: 16S rRNA methyltransferase [Candidatus Micrarchaeia archaeon]
MLTLILTESALETIPKEIANHPTVRQECKRRGKKPSEILLDSSKHYKAMQKLEHFEKRGRPDIIHFCLLLAQDSVLNKKKMLRLFVHTYNDKVISINPATRLPPSYNRFSGLIENLFSKEKIESSEQPLLSVEKKTLKQLLNKLKCNNALALEADAVKKDAGELSGLLSNDACVIMGGFPHGTFLDKSNALTCIRKISIASQELCAWTVASMVLNAAERDIDK